MLSNKSSIYNSGVGVSIAPIETSEDNPKVTELINTPEFEAIKDSIHPEGWVGKLIVTLGERGCMMMKENGFHYYTANKVPVFDLSGAGDSFLAALVAKQLETNNIDEAIKYANEKASEIVQRRGVSVITE